MKKLNKTQIHKIRAIIGTKSGCLAKNHRGQSLLILSDLFKGRKIYYRTPGMRGKRSGICGAADIARDVCRVIGYPLTHDNDGPRNGELYDYYQLSGRTIKFDRAEFLAQLDLKEC